MPNSAAALLRMLEEAPAAVALQRGRELRYDFANARYRQFLGGRELVGLTLAEVLPDWAQLRRILDGVMTGGQPYLARERRFLVDPDGDGALRDAWFDLVCQPLVDPDGSVAGVITFAVDVTAQVLARQHLEKIADELRRAVDARDVFLSVASHELRTPLTALRLQVQAVQRSLLRTPERQYSVDQLRSRIDAADRQVNRLVELIDALLDVSRLQGGRIDLSVADVELAAVAAEVVERARAAATAAGSTLTLRAPGPVAGQWDGSRVDQVVTNLVSNAIKYGRGEPIDVEVGVESDGRQRAFVRVTDRGIGIAPADQERIFDRFERAVSRTHYSGLGLGLWISRQIAQALGGDVTVESVPGDGSVFTLWLPRRDDPPR